MTRLTLIIPTLVALLVSGPVWASNHYSKTKWHTHHLMCWRDLKPTDDKYDIYSFPYFHFTYLEGKDGNVKKLVAQREMTQFPSFGKTLTYTSHFREGGTNWSTIKNLSSGELVFTLITETPGREHHSEVTISKSRASFKVKYFSPRPNGRQSIYDFQRGGCRFLKDW